MQQIFSVRNEVNRIKKLGKHKYSLFFLLFMLCRRIWAKTSSPRRDWTLIGDEGISPTSRVFRIRAAPDGKPSLPFQSGQYALLSFPKRGLLVRPHPCRIVTGPQEQRYMDFYLKDEDPWTYAAQQVIKTANTTHEKITIRVDGAFGKAYPPITKGRYIFLAAGMGGFAFLSSLYALHYADISQKNLQILLLWGARTQEDIPLEELAYIAKLVPSLRYRPILSHDPLSSERGRIDTERLERHIPSFFGFTQELFEWNMASYWISGPPPFRKDLLRILKTKGVHKQAIHIDKGII